MADFMETSPSENGIVAALMGELGALLEKFLETGVRDSIDLHRIPLTDQDLLELEQQLGTGEITISFDALGESRITETAHAGLWRVEHRNPSGDLIAHLVEVGDVPSIVSAGRSEMRAAAAAMTNDHSSSGGPANA
ncbi:hydrogenase expression/formation C-terminal domain-containing protein [Aquicoccus sp. SU-CL01552]|uniref:hydrogenase expression/formation C-terminal domain-containing protein n=1 Tax=Aquicoccus sp. SU-CL01552 TaxID=3127656 RepID=UPI0031050D50